MAEQPPAPGAPEHLIVGRVIKAHAIKGEVLVRPVTDRPDTIYVEGRKLLLGDAVGEPDSGAPPLLVEGVRPHNRGLIVRFAGYADRTAAESLEKHVLLAPTEEVEPPAEDELFYHELLGLEVVTEQGERVGRVREIIDAGPSQLLEVEGTGDTHLVPFAEPMIVLIDLEQRRLTIAPPPGLLEL